MIRLKRSNPWFNFNLQINIFMKLTTISFFWWIRLKRFLAKFDFSYGHLWMQVIFFYLIEVDLLTFRWWCVCWGREWTPRRHTTAAERGGLWDELHPPFRLSIAFLNKLTWKSIKTSCYTQWNLGKLRRIQDFKIRGLTIWSSLEKHYVMSSI